MSYRSEKSQSSSINETKLAARGKMYRAVRREFPDLEMTSKILDLLVGEDLGYGTVEQGWLWDIPKAPDSWTAAHADNSNWAWSVIPQDIVDVVKLAYRGEAENILVAAALCSHDYDSYGGLGPALVDGYTELIPAIVSSLAAPSLLEGRLPDVPPWYFQDGRRVQIGVNALTMALSPMLSEDQRRVLLLDSLERPDTKIQVDSDEIELREGLSLMLEELIVAGVQAGLNLSFYIEPEAINDRLESFSEMLTDPNDPDVDYYLPIYYPAVLVTRYAKDLHSSLESISKEAAEDTYSWLEDTYPWLVDWRPWQLIDERVWPPTVEEVRRANLENNW